MKRSLAILVLPALAVALVSCTSSTQPPSIGSFSAGTSTLTAGSSTQLTWSVTGTAPITLAIDHGVGDVTGKTSVTVQPTQTTTYTLTASNTAGKATKQVKVTVRSASGSTVTVTQQGTPEWIAVQDGSGAWTPLAGSTFDVTDAGGRYGVAWVCDLAPAGTTAKATGVEVLQLTLADATSLTAACPTVTVLYQHTYTGSVANVPANGTAVVSIGGAYAQINAAPWNYTLNTVPEGKQIGLAYGFDSSSQPGNMVVKTFDVTGDGTWSPDLGTGKPFTVNTLDVSNLPRSVTSATLFAELAPDGTSLAEVTKSSNTSKDYVALPAGTLPSGHLYSLGALAGFSPSAVRALLLTSTPASTETLALPSPMGSGAGFSVSGGAATASYGAVTFPSSGGTMFDGVFFGNSGYTLQWSLIQTKAWLGSATSYAVPDFSAVAGWNGAWDFAAGTHVSATVSGGHTNEPFAAILPLLSYHATGTGFGTLLPPDGTLYQNASEDFTATY